MSLRHDRIMRMIERTIARGAMAGTGRLRTEDDRLDGPFITVNGRRMLDFGSASYLGLNRDERLKSAAKDAIDRFGTTHSSSAMYTALGMYTMLEERLERIVGASVAIVPTTTLAHLSALPVLIGEGDLVLMDQHAHASLQLAASVLQAEGVEVRTIPHNDMPALEEYLQGGQKQDDAIWYIADGIYSMVGDVAPVATISRLMDEYPQLHVYYDDAHGFGWYGLHGRGHVLEHTEWRPRMVVAAGLSKSFGAMGAVLAFGDPAMARRVQYCGPPLTFSGPLQPAALGAAIASADFHLSEEHARRQSDFTDRIAWSAAAISRHGLPAVGFDPTPIWFIKLGRLEPVLRLVSGLMEDGFYVNPAGYPAVPIGSAGIRISQTMHHTPDHITALFAAVEERLAPQTEIIVDLTALEKADASTNPPTSDVPTPNN